MGRKEEDYDSLGLSTTCELSLSMPSRNQSMYDAHFMEFIVDRPILVHFRIRNCGILMVTALSIYMKLDSRNAVLH